MDSCSAPSRERALRRNDKSPRSRWSIGWLSGISVKGLTFDDGQQAKLSVSSIDIPAGLLKLLPRTKKIGTISVVQPQVSLTLSEVPPGGDGGGDSGGQDAPEADKEPRPTSAEKTPVRSLIATAGSVSSSRNRSMSPVLSSAATFRE